MPVRHKVDVTHRLVLMDDTMVAKKRLANVLFGFAFLFISLCSQGRCANWDFQEVIIDENPPQPARITDCSIVDIDGDGKLDLWYSARPGRNEKAHFMPWYENTGDMQNWLRHLPFEGPSCYGTWGDVDDDGDMDLIAGKDRKQALQWMQNPSNEGGNPRKGTWKIYRIYPGALMDPDEVHAAYVGPDSRIHQHLDMNGDGRLDFVVAKYNGPVYYIPTPAKPKTPSGSWTFHEIGESGGTARLADFDGDGDIDVAIAQRWHRNPGDPTKPWKTFTYGDFKGDAKIAVGDMDGDGRLDIILSGEESEQGVAWFCNPGADAADKWEKHIVIKANTGWKGLHSLQVADFDCDGDLDVFTAQMHGRPGQRIAVVENVDGRGTKWQAHILSNCGTHNAKVADIDGDGDPDIVGKNYEDDKRPRIWLNPNNPKRSLSQWRGHPKGKHAEKVARTVIARTGVQTGAQGRRPR